MEITTSNCNYHLTRLYKERDDIGNKLDDAIVKCDDEKQKQLESRYHSVCDTIDEFIEFRKNHNCLLEGDPGYGPL